ncbi:MAG TPA: universal stress protein [Nannocystaceae bacterium]|nr:universal stress protein [Nannocystaceae bacterium]
MTNVAKKWIVGLDLGERSQGALQFAAWMAQQGGDRLIALHVLEEDYLLSALRYHHLDEVQALARKAAEAAVDRAGARTAIASIEVLEGQTAEDSLVAARTYHRCDGIVIGRNAPRDGARIVRLGRVARRVLRALPSPVFVVPPDLGQIGAGPVIVGVDVEEEGSTAVEFARAFAERFGRPLELVAVSPVLDVHGAQYWPAETVAKIRADHARAAEQQLAAWASARNLANATRTVRLGSVAEELVSLARERDALTIVTGSRKLSMFDRWLLASTGSELAGHATCPVAIVPPA